MPQKEGHSAVDKGLRSPVVEEAPKAQESSSAEDPVASEVDVVDFEIHMVVVVDMRLLTEVLEEDSLAREAAEVHHMEAVDAEVGMTAALLELDIAAGIEVATLKIRAMLRNLFLP